jgi:hypothetical protein
MAAQIRIENPKGGDGTPAPGEVEGVDMWEGNRRGTKIEGGGGKGGETPFEVAAEIGICVGEGIECSDIVRVDGRVPCPEEA